MANYLTFGVHTNHDPWILYYVEFAISFIIHIVLNNREGNSYVEFAISFIIHIVLNNREGNSQIELS